MIETMSTHKNVNRSGRSPSPPAAGWRVGNECNYHSRIGGPVTTSGHRIRELGMLGSGKMVAWITGKTGCVAVEALSANAELRHGATTPMYEY